MFARTTVGFVALLFLLSGCTTSGPEAGTSTPRATASNAVSSTAPLAPEIEAVDVVSRQAVRLSQQSGKPVLINFMATWCTPCKRELPALDRLRLDLNGELIVWAVGSDPNEAPKVLQQYMQQAGVAIPTFYDGAKSANRYRVIGIPVTVLIGPDGEVKAKHTGELSYEEARKLVQEKIGI